MRLISLLSFLIIFSCFGLFYANYASLNSIHSSNETENNKHKYDGSYDLDSVTDYKSDDYLNNYGDHHHLHKIYVKTDAGFRAVYVYE
jgi:hypothetical protein